TVDFTTGAVTGVETLTGSTGGDTVTMTAAQFAGFNAINTGGGTDTLIVNINGTVDISSGNNPTLTSLETVSLNGSAGNDTITLTGAQLNGFTKIDLGGGTNTINLTSTSTGLNGLSDVNLANVVAISATGAAAGVVINLGNQSEGFTITGSSNADTI